MLWNAGVSTCNTPGGGHEFVVHRSTIDIPPIVDTNNTALASHNIISAGFYFHYDLWDFVDLIVFGAYVGRSQGRKYIVVVDNSGRSTKKKKTLKGGDCSRPVFLLLKNIVYG